MIFDRWRARRAMATRNPPSTIEDVADPRLLVLLEGLQSHVDARDSLGDPAWHYRWEGELQLVGLDATTRSVTDVRQRLMRLVHEVDLRHIASRARRVLAVVMCTPRDGEDLTGWHARLQDDRGEVGESDWRAGRRRIAVLAVASDDGRRKLFGGDRGLVSAVAAWEAALAAVPESDTESS